VRTHRQRIELGYHKEVIVVIIFLGDGVSRTSTNLVSTPNSSQKSNETLELKGNHNILAKYRQILRINPKAIKTIIAHELTGKQINSTNQINRSKKL
jgi:hypothetical protein